MLYERPSARVGPPKLTEMFPRRISATFSGIAGPGCARLTVHARTTAPKEIKNLFKETALGTGVGIRYDFDFLVLRLDWGVGLHLPYDTGRSGYFNIGKFKDVQTLHLAIGYPF